MDSDIIEDIRKMLEFYEAMGITGLPVPTEDKPRGREASGQTEKQGFLASDKRSLDRSARLSGLREEIGDCRRCRLSEKRKNIVFGEGDPCARLMFIGEGPGREEDVQARPFVGEAGMLLTNLIEKMGLKRDEVYIANIVKCRPPLNRDPEPEEIAVCRRFIEEQVRIILPAVIVALGRISAQTLLGRPDLKITAARGNFFVYEGIPVMPTFHPAYLLRNPKDKWLTWSDAQKVLEKLNGGR